MTMHALQLGVVVLIVAGCCAHATWTLLPLAARRAVANTLLRLPLPTRLAAPLRRAASVSEGCACTGCDRSKASKVRHAEVGTTHRVTFHSKLRR